MRRRTVIAGMAAVAVIAPPASLRAEDRMYQLLEELADLMPNCMNGRFRAIVNPDGMCWLQAVDLPIPFRQRARPVMLYRIIKGRWLFWRARRARRLAERHKRRYLHSLVAVERHYGLRAVPGWRVPNHPY